MGVRIKHLLASITLVTSSTVTAIAANAQTQPAPFKPREVIPEAVDEAFYGRKDTASITQNGITRPLELMLGAPGFPELLIARDAERVHRLYRDLLVQQNSSDPLIRTADLPNPFNSSVLTQPSISSRVPGSEYTIEQPQFTPQPAYTPQPMLPQRY